MHERVTGSSEGAGVERGDLGSLGGSDHRLAEPGRAARADALAEIAIAEATLGDQLEALEHSNARLKESADAAAHDLSEGLATIALFAEALEDRLGHELDPAVVHYLDGIRAGIARMSSLVRATLESTGGADRHVPVDTNVALREALANLAARMARTDAKLVAEPLPCVVGDAADLMRLFQNLLANALKSQDPARPLRIRVGARREGRRWRFEIDDTGIGIPPELARAFESSAPEIVPGRGLGLAICRRIVEDHGGNIRAVPRAGGGTSVGFDLPVCEAGLDAVTRPGSLGRSGRPLASPAREFQVAPFSARRP